MGGILMALAIGCIFGAVLAPRYLIPWVRWRWPDFAKAVFGALFLLACLTEPVPAQVPVDTVQVPYDSTWTVVDSVVTRQVTFSHDTTATFYRDSIITLPPVDTTTTPPAGILSAIEFRAKGDQGAGIPWAWSGGQVVTDPVRGAVLQFSYNAGRVGGTAPGNVYLDASALRAKGLRSATITGWIYVSPNWQGHLTNTNKALFIGMGDNGNQLILNLFGKGAGPLRAVLQFQGMASLTIPKATCGRLGCSGISGGLPFSRGVWHHVAISVTPTTATLTLDGQRAASVTGLQWTNGTPYLAKVALNPTWGGGGDKVTATMHLRWDAVQVMTP